MRPLRLATRSSKACLTYARPIVDYKCRGQSRFARCLCFSRKPFRHIYRQSTGLHRSMCRRCRSHGHSQQTLRAPCCNQTRRTLELNVGRELFACRLVACSGNEKMKGKSRQITHAYLFFTLHSPCHLLRCPQILYRAIIWASRQSAVCAGETAMAHAHSIITACVPEQSFGNSPSGTKLQNPGWQTHSPSTQRPCWEHFRSQPFAAQVAPS